MMQVTKVWWDGESLMAEPIDPAAIYKEPEQPAQQQEPVAYQYQSKDGVWRDFISQSHYEATVEDGSWPIRALYTSPQPAQQEPEYWLWACGQHIQVSLKKPEFPDAIPLYTSPPPQRTWVGLTDEDLEAEFGFIDELLRDCSYRIEAKLKEKNSD